MAATKSPIKRSNQHSMPTLFYPSMKLADMIDINYHLLQVLSRFGISLGFGEISINDICNKHNISTDTFLIICNIHSFNEYHPGSDVLRKINISDIVSYLRSSHIYYTSTQIPQVKRHLNELTATYEPIHQKILNRFFDDYSSEVLNHFHYEDDTVFPYIDGLINGNKTNDYCIEQFEHNHSNIDEKLCDLKNIVVKYLPENNSAELRNQLLLEIYSLENDLAKHTLIENKILIPLVTDLEINYCHGNK